jgi:hypothetical protein
MSLVLLVFSLLKIPLPSQDEVRFLDIDLAFLDIEISVEIQHGGQA